MLSVLLISLFVLGLASGPIFGYFLLRNQKIGNVALMVILFVLGLGLAFLIFFSTGTFFVSGITCLLIPFALIVLLIFLYWRKNHKESIESDRVFRRWYWLGAILTPLILTLPFFEIFMIQAACVNLNQRAAAPIIAALESYKNSHGDYPEELDDLMPEFLDTIPAGRCAPISKSEYDKPIFDITICTPEDVTILTVPIGSGEWIQRYNTETGLWARISFLDGACSYLE